MALAGLAVAGGAAAAFLLERGQAAGARAEASEPSPLEVSRASRDPASPGEERVGMPRADATTIVVEPLFDAKHARLRPGEPAVLRFRATDPAGASVSAAELSLSLIRTPGNEEVLLAAREIGGGLYEVPFTPDAPGQYSVRVAARGGMASALPPVNASGGAPGGSPVTGLTPAGDGTADLEHSDVLGDELGGGRFVRKHGWRR